MTKIKLCGLTQPCDIEAANELCPDYIGFVFAPNSRRFIAPAQAGKHRQRLLPAIKAVGVFVNESPETVAGLLEDGVIDIAQLHGAEDETYIGRLRQLTDKPIIRAFRIDTAADIAAAQASTADHVLLDSGVGGTGTAFDWELLRHMRRPYFLAGGLDLHNVGAAVAAWHPYAVDVSSGIETNGRKDKNKMVAFVAAVRKENSI